MAFQSRKIKIAILNDSVYVGALIYISSIATAAIVVTNYGLDGYLNVKESLISGAYCVLATAFLGVVFIPKASHVLQPPPPPPQKKKKNYHMIAQLESAKECKPYSSRMYKMHYTKADILQS